MPDQNQDTDDEIQFPDELDRFAIDDTDDGRVPDVDEVENDEDMWKTEEQTEDTADDVVEEITQQGFITDGLTQNEALALVGVTFISYALAWGVLSVMGDAGLNNVPIYLWGVLMVLILTPLLMLFGAEVVDRINDIFVR